MDKIKTVKIKNEDGSVSKESYYISADARNIDMTNGYNVQETIGTIDVNNDGSIAEQLNNINKKKPYYFNTVADMKDANLQIGDIAITLGYYKINDCGGAKYIIKETTSLYNEELNNSKVAELIYEYEHNPFQFGAYCDGSHDDAFAIRNGINFLNACHGGTLNLLNGYIYLIKTRATTNTFFYLKDQCDIVGKSTLKIADNFGDWNFFFSKDSEINKLTLKDFTIDENSIGNPPTEHTGESGKIRTIFRLINNTVDYWLKDLTFNNLTINDCLGTWQYEFEGKCENVKIENCKINYNDTYNVNYDRTSVYLGINNCYFMNNILNGSDNARTGIELHGHNIVCANNIITNYSSGIYIVNDPSNPSNTENKFLQVYSNKIFTRGNGILMWLVFDNMHTEGIDIYNNNIHILNSERTSTAKGIGTYATLSNNSSIDFIKIYNNNIHSDFANTEMLSFRSTSSNINFYLKNLLIESNNITGVYKNAMLFASNLNNTFYVDNITFSRNTITLGQDVTSWVYFLVRDGIKNILCEDNSFILNNYNPTYIFRIPGTGQEFHNIRFLNNHFDKDIYPNQLYNSEIFEAFIEQYFSKINYLTNANDISLNLEYFKVANGSFLRDSNNYIYKIDSHWIAEGTYYKENPQHIYANQGDSYKCISSNGTVYKEISEAGFFEDHITGVEKNKVGEWVRNNNSIVVFKVLTENTLTTATNDNEYFVKIGTKATYIDK